MTLKFFRPELYLLSEDTRQFEHGNDIMTIKLSYPTNLEKIAIVCDGFPPVFVDRKDYTYRGQVFYSVLQEIPFDLRLYEVIDGTLASEPSDEISNIPPRRKQVTVQYKVDETFLNRKDYNAHVEVKVEGDFIVPAYQLRLVLGENGGEEVIGEPLDKKRKYEGSYGPIRGEIYLEETSKDEELTIVIKRED